MTTPAVRRERSSRGRFLFDVLAHPRDRLRCLRKFVGEDREYVDHLFPELNRDVAERGRLRARPSDD
jgi:hypothetical protein